MGYWDVRRCWKPREGIWWRRDIFWEAGVAIDVSVVTVNTGVDWFSRVGLIDAGNVWIRDNKGPL